LFFSKGDLALSNVGGFLSTDEGGILKLEVTVDYAVV